MKKILLLLITFSLIFSFALVKAQDEENKNEDDRFEKIEIKYKPLKFEVKLPKLSEKDLGPFKEIDDFIRDKITEYPGASFFMLLPSKNASQQGIIEQNQNNLLIVNSDGLKMNWIITTDTDVIFASSTNDIATGTKVRIFGTWDGNQLNAKRVVVIEKRILVEVEILLQRIKEALQKLGINIDLTPLLQQLQR